jgi:hypothetical protein
VVSSTRGEVARTRGPGQRHNFAVDDSSVGLFLGPYFVAVDDLLGQTLSSPDEEGRLEPIKGCEMKTRCSPTNERLHCGTIITDLRLTSQT